MANVSKPGAGIFNLLEFDDTNQDSYLIANGFLIDKLKKVKNEKIKKIENDIYDLEKILLQIQNKLYKTLDANEYNIQKNLMINIENQLNNMRINYNDIIEPSFEDIAETHFLFLNNQYKPFVEFTFEYTKATINTKPLFNGEVTFNIPIYGEFLSDMVLHVQLSELTPQQSTDKVRYADFLGHKLISNIQFIIGNNVIDQYTGEFYNVYYNLYVPDYKKKSWLKCMGQESPIYGTLIQDPINDNFKEQKVLFNGYQTLKNTQDVVDLFIPLLFWFNTDPRLALPNNFSPLGQVQVRAKFQNDNQLMTCLDVVDGIYHENYNKPAFNECQLYTRHIFISADIQDLFISKIGFVLVRIHKQIEKQLDKNNDSISLSADLKFPTEEVFIYCRPDINESGIDSLNTWYKNSVLNLVQIQTPVAYNINGTPSFGINYINYYDETPIFTSFDLSVNGSSPHGNNNVNFYDSYLTYMAGKNISNASNMYYIPYTYFPNDHQPCGYLNMSKAREIYLNYSSHIIEDYAPVKLYMHAISLNFLLYTDSSAILKYIT